MMTPLEVEGKFHFVSSLFIIILFVVKLQIDFVTNSLFEDTIFEHLVTCPSLALASPGPAAAASPTNSPTPDYDRMPRPDEEGTYFVKFQVFMQQISGFHVTLLSTELSYICHNDDSIHVLERAETVVTTTCKCRPASPTNSCEQGVDDETLV